MTLPYRFADAERAIVIDRHDLPMPWINYLSNGRLHAFVSQAGGGLCWWRSPTIFRLTRYRMYNLPLDSPGFYVYVRHPDGETWSPSCRPCETVLDSWRCTHQPGCTTFTARKGDIESCLRLFVAPDHDTLVWDLGLKNLGCEAIAIDVFGYVELSQLMFLREVTGGYYQKTRVRTWHDPDLDAMLYMYHAAGQPREDATPLVYFASTRKSESFAGDRDAFTGHYRSERNPIAVERGHCGNSELQGGEGCAAIAIRLTLAAGQEDRSAFFLGATPGVLKDKAAAIQRTAEELAALRTPGAVEQQHRKLDAWWANHLGKLQCSIPDKDGERHINIWNPTQCVHTGRHSRSISSQASGNRGVGFRDTCQDMLAIAYRDPEWAKRLFTTLLAHQFEDGSAVHEFWLEEPRTTARGITYCDDHLWLPLLAYGLVSETGDLSLLRKNVPFLAADLVSAGPQATAWDHLLAAMRFTQSHLGGHGLPLILSADWNDHFGMYGRLGRGESIFAAEQYVYALRLLLSLAGVLRDDAAGETLGQMLQSQLAAISAHAWDGRWWRRGYDDDGKPVGSEANEIGKIWLNTQSWAVIGQVGAAERLAQGMEAARERLNTKIGIRLYTPPHPAWTEKKGDLNVGGHSPGWAENGGIFCHANTWAVIAEALLGHGDQAWQYYRQIIPHVALQTAGLERYQAEPYAYVSVIAAPENIRFGATNVTQVTGTAAWMDVAATHYLLGIRAELAGLRIDPCIPHDWPGFTVTRNYRGCQVRITVDNPTSVQHGVAAMTVNGAAVDLSNGPVVPAGLLAGAGRPSADVAVRMGAKT